MKKLTILALIFSLFTYSSASASGGSRGSGGATSSGSAGSSGGAKRRSIDQERYKRGQQVYNGRAKLASKVVSQSLLKKQLKDLRSIQKIIAKKDSVSAAKRINVRRLSGRMTAKQLSDLRYYVRIRYSKTLSRSRR